MKSLKNHISLIIPLFAILFAVEFYLIIDRLIADYEVRLSSDYSIVVVSKKPLTLEELKVVDPGIQSMKEIDSTLIINRLKENSISVNYEELKEYLPHFYRVYLETLPSSQQLEELREKLSKVDGIERVETFRKTHRKIYHFLLFVKNISKLFLFIIFVTSVMLVFKQIEVWNLEHQERMYIMALFGAPLWMRNAILVKLSIIDTTVSTILVYITYSYLISSGSIVKLLGIEDLSIDPAQIAGDMLWLFGIGLFISMVNIIIVSSRQYRIATV
ncbi:MAG: cell division protein FtsX [Epsilonproteobacteria bacterium]|nr:cell division protein FtsX [Campylobacterota bacterium]NPA57288.1 cell division protein FtsX [Campylobacterota bacterium]